MDKSATVALMLQMRAIVETLSAEQKETYNSILEVTIKYATEKESDFLKDFSEEERQQVVEHLRLSLLER